MNRAAIPVDRIERSILVLRGHKVLLDADIANLHDVATKVLLQAVRRNPDRFPKDFMFQLTDQEFINLLMEAWSLRKDKSYCRWTRLWTNTARLEPPRTPWISCRWLKGFNRRIQARNAGWAW